MQANSTSKDGQGVDDNAIAVLDLFCSTKFPLILGEHLCDKKEDFFRGVKKNRQRKGGSGG